MTSEAKKEGLPTWAKMLIGLVVTAFVCLALVIVSSIWFFQKVAKEAQDPVAMARCLKQIANVPMPLPDGYKLLMGFGFAGIDTVTVEHNPDKQMMILISYPAKGSEDLDTLVQKLYGAGMNTPQASAQFEEVKGKGKDTIAGLPMSYIIGQMSDKGGAKFEGLVGCVLSKDKNKTIVIYGVEPPGTKYNIDETMNFLKTIKSF